MLFIFFKNCCITNIHEHIFDLNLNLSEFIVDAKKFLINDIGHFTILDYQLLKKNGIWKNIFDVPTTFPLYFTGNVDLLNCFIKSIFYLILLISKQNFRFIKSRKRVFKENLLNN